MTPNWKTAALVVLSVLLAVGEAAAQTDYPTRMVRLIVGFGPGSSPDIVARIIGDRLFQVWNRPVVIENVTGAAGNIAGERVARAAPDGYTLLLAANSGLAINPHLYRMSYDPVRDLAPISQLCSYANILAVNNDLPATNVQELVALARAQPGALTYGSAGTGTTLHLAGELLKSMAKIDIRHIPSRTATPFSLDVVAGRISMMFGPPTALLPLAREGKVKALAVTSSQRQASAPDLPTMTESGFPGFEVTAWFGLMAPAGTPPTIIEKLHGETARILALPDVRKRFEDLGIEPIGNSPSEFAAIIKAEGRKWAKVIKEAGISPLD
jgi:tripartite-type tricarboxylate transporter receptor subunit TctC